MTPTLMSCIMKKNRNSNRCINLLLEEKFYCHIQFWMNQVCVKLLHARIRCTEINKKVINLIIPLNLKIYNQEIARNELLIVTRAT